MPKVARRVSILLLGGAILVLASLPAGSQEPSGGWDCASDYLITSYWTVAEGFYTGPKIPIYDVDNHLLGYYREDFVAAVKVEGWGKGDGDGNDGRYLGYDYLTDEFYVSDAPLDAYGNPLVEWETVAVDPQVEPGSSVDIVDLGPNPDVSDDVRAKLLNNTFVANDIGAGVTGHHIDVYVGDQIAADMNETDLALYIEGATVCLAPPGSIGTEAAFRVTREGDVYADGAFNCGLDSLCFNSGSGADIAEYIRASEPLGPGDVVELDPDQPGRYRKSHGPYSKLAVGTISTAPGVLLEEPGPERYPLALMGTVPVKATAENGPIRPGDLLTTSSTQGYAMRCSDLQKCEGAIIGKALEPLEEGLGIIRMLVMH
jgi:3D (Asp-Asp-Asp) domain-containing protein